MKLWLLVVLLWACATTAQVVGPGFVDYVTSAPSGACSQGAHQQNVLGAGTVYTCQSGTWATVGGGGSGTVTSFSAGTLSPLFTTSVATATTTPALSFSLSTVIQNTVFAGSNAGGTVAPTFRTLVSADLPAGTGTVTSIATTSPITGGTITATGTIACATCVTSAAPLATGGVVLGTAGTQASATNTALTFSGATLTVGLAGTSSGILALTGSASGTVTFTAPATAGTTTNAVTMTNVLTGPNGAAGTPTFAMGVSSGMYNVAGGGPAISAAGTNIMAFEVGSPGNVASLIRGNTLGWATSFLNNIDTGLSSPSAGVVDVGTGAANSTAGSINLTGVTASGTVSGALYATATNCAGVGTAASPSVVTCAAAAAGAFSCATNASAATCQVNTTAVTANSEIIVVEVADEGSRLSVTCNTSPTVTPAILLASKSAGSNFIINMPTITTNPACFDYWIVN